jgi:hypothetical protein
MSDDSDDFFEELQKLACERDDITITVDENGEIEFEIDLELFIELLSKK